MMYFIPAWYQQNMWCENEQNWHTRRMHSEFDDTVKQIQLFHRSKEFDYEILLLAFSPNFRHFLHRQGVYHAPYWSCFDAIQTIRRRRVMVLSYHNINWPKDIEFMHTPFVIIAKLHGKKYAQIEFGEDGNPIQIDMFENDIICRRNLYDDRGFVSSTILYKEGNPYYQDYLNEEGVWKVRCDLTDGHVDINPAIPFYLLQHDGIDQNVNFKQLRYDSLEQVIEEVFGTLCKEIGKDNIFCLALHPRHTKMVMETLNDRKVILSFFEGRYHLTKQPEAREVLEKASYVITDSMENSLHVSHFLQRIMHNLTDISPYDSRVDFGISQQLSVQKILVPVDGMDEEMFGLVILQLALYLEQNANAMIHIFTRDASMGRNQQLLEKIRGILREAGLCEAYALEEDKMFVAENNLEDEITPTRFFVEQCISELEVSKCMREQRLLVDLRKKPELYLQISALSMGIPQIVFKRTQFVEDGMNGIVLYDINDLQKKLAFYLDGLANWNEAMVFAYELGKKFTTRELLDAWKEVIETVG